MPRRDPQQRCLPDQERRRRRIWARWSWRRPVLPATVVRRPAHSRPSRRAHAQPDRRTGAGRAGGHPPRHGPPFDNPSS